MKKVFKYLLTTMMMVSAFSGCNKNPVSTSIELDMSRTYTKLESDSLYVRKVENIGDDFIMGMDASSVISLENAGIKSALISNNATERVEAYNSLLGLPAYPDAKKPSTKAILTALNEMGVATAEAAGLGDQLLTDAWAVHKLDMISLIVPPIKDKKTLFFRFKRLLEKPFMKRYYKLKSKN